MNATEAMTWLWLRLLPDQEPYLDAAAVAELLRMARTVDASGLAPSDEDWTPTYSIQGLYRAAAEGWDIKAAKASGNYDFTADGQTFRRSQVIDHCRAQAAIWRRKTNRSTTITEWGS